MVEIIPSILVQSQDEFLKKYRSLKDSIDMIQIDIADGLFVPNTTWADPDVIQKEVDIDIELHLMVANPLTELTKWKAVPQISRVLIHYESIDLKDAMPILASYPWDIGVVLNPDTEITVLEPFIDQIDLVMFMGVIPGKQGQPFVEHVLEKILLFHAAHPHMYISIDGAVNNETLPRILASGVNAVCPGSAIVGSGNPEENVKEMKAFIHSLTV